MITSLWDLLDNYSGIELLIFNIYSFNDIHIISSFLTNANINTNLPDMCYLKFLLMCFSFLFIHLQAMPAITSKKICGCSFESYSYWQTWTKLCIHIRKQVAILIFNMRIKYIYCWIISPNLLTKSRAPAPICRTLFLLSTIDSKYAPAVISPILFSRKLPINRAVFYWKLLRQVFHPKVYKSDNKFK